MRRFDVLDLILVFRYIEHQGQERLIPPHLAQRTADTLEALVAGEPLEDSDDDNEPF